MTTAPKMLWIDIETTGLVAQTDVPLELGLMLTDEWGDQIANRKWLIWENTDRYQTAWDNMDTFVVGMHEKSRLHKDLVTFTPDKRSYVELDAIDWLKGEGVEQGTLPLAGNSIGSLDRPFVLTHFPALNDFVHYRNIDISTIKEICKMTNPILFDKSQEILGTKEDSEHRVIRDILASIREYRFYLENFLFVDDNAPI